jgi:hypothetical protein
MASAAPPDLIERFVDLLHAQLKRGMGVDAAVADLERLFPEAGQRLALRAAADELKRRTASIEHLRRPTTLRAQGRPAWYPGPRDTDDFWPPLKRYLLDTKKWDPSLVESIDTSSTKVVSCLDFPGNPTFSTKGLVLGYVQSGKTANFTATISKAADAGFRVFLVLSGLTNSLRQQTQERLTRELVMVARTRWHTWTDADKDIGDYPFNPDAMLAETNSRHLAVVKKNGPRLRRLLRMLRGADMRLRQSCPVLIIDDECDQASVNASGAAERMTAINRLLRDLIRELPRCAYVGYTATPYANVLIDPAYPEDLYPRDFIVSLPKPDRYFGAERLFGRDLLEADAVPPADSGLNMIRAIEDAEIPLLRPASREQKDSFALSVTKSLDEAIRYYWLATAAKAFRGLAADHSCMLIHTTVYARSHLNSRPVLEDHIRRLATAIDRRDAGIIAGLKTLWEKEQEKLPSALLDLAPVSFESLLPHLAGSAALPEVVVENAISDARLDFSEPGRRYIVIGGNVLARGLTIEGLVVSLFLRTASQYDTLMQMGRWFGYRIGYEDLPRIWMPPEMAEYFRDMATVEAEIRYDIETYERESTTPLSFAVRVRMHHDLEITAPAKMFAAVDCKMSFSGDHIQTRKFYEQDDDWLTKNWGAGSKLLDRAHGMGNPNRHAGGVFYEKTPFAEIIRFLTEYKVHPSHRQFAGSRVIDYVREQNAARAGSMATWNVGIVCTQNGVPSEQPLGPLGTVNTVDRAKLIPDLSDHVDIKALMSRIDALIDLPKEPNRREADWKTVNTIRRRAFPEGRPLLLLYPINRNSQPRSEDRAALKAVRDVLGMAIVFPETEHEIPLGYKRAPIDESRDEQAEYEEEVLTDDDAAAR